MTVLLPNCRFLFLWNSIYIIAVVFSALEIPLRYIFNYQPPLWLKVTDLILVIFFISDIYIRFHSAYYQYGKIVDQKKKIRKHYLKNGFLLDFLAAFPTDVFFYFVFGGIGSGSFLYTFLKAFRIFRIIRVVRIFSLYKRQSNLLEIPISVSIMKYTVTSLVITHYIACGWIISGEITDKSDLITTYNKAIYWSITTLTTVGYGDISPSTNFGRTYTMLVMILGVGMYAFIIGNISNITRKSGYIKRKTKNKNGTTRILYEVPFRSRSLKI